MTIKSLLSMMLIAGLVLASCSSRKATKSTVGNATIKIPCSNYKSDDEYFRASQSANSTDLASSRDNALFAAKRRLAGIIETKIKEVGVRYSEERKIGNKSEFSEKIENEARSVVSQNLVDVNIVCEETLQKDDGSYNTFVAVECKKETLYNGMHSAISKNEKLRQDYDQQQFRKVFEEEMKKLEEQQP